MGANKIHIVFMLLISIQIALTTSPEDNSNSSQSSEEQLRNLSPNPSIKLFIYTFEQFVPLGQNVAIKSLNLSRYILKDESLVANPKTDVAQFRQNVGNFVEKYDTTNGNIDTQDILNIYSNITQYCDIPEKNATPEKTLISGVLNKYNCKDIVKKFVEEFTAFQDGFIKRFDDEKIHLEKPLLDWYGKYNTLTNLEQRFEAFSDFLKMA